MTFLCPKCSGPVTFESDRIKCVACGVTHGTMQGDIIVFDNCHDKYSFFEKQAVERLDRYYAGYNREKFLDDLQKTVLWQMDEGNKRVGITRKFWWEEHIGKLENKNILEIGCGVNYLVPYFVYSGNSVFAFDVCKESVEYSKRLVSTILGNTDGVTFAVADARIMEFPKVFDVVDISNVLHHIDDKNAVFERIHRALKDDGKLIIVEPNYYYPPRWSIETTSLDPFNFVKNYFVKNDLIEQNEHAIIFNDMIPELERAGFRVDVRQKDDNYIGYFIVYWLKEKTKFARGLFELDKHLLSRVLPRVIAPFEFIVASKA
jgi:SAM-dependent methyltransferase